jgi:hypothetical protein
LLGGITGIETLEVVVELGIRQPDEFGERCGIFSQKFSIPAAVLRLQ